MGSAASSGRNWFFFISNELARAFAASLLVFLICLPVFSQGSQGTIQGGVFDQSGGAIAGATVTIIDASRGISRPLTTDSAGAYSAANLTPGAYTVRGEAKGFQTLERPNVLVGVGQNIRVDLTLQPGAQTQTITVTSEVPAVDTTDATLGGTVNNQQINDLPLNGRNYQRLLLLRPGVVGAIGSGTGLESSNGLRTGENLTMVQGLASIGSQQGGSVFNLAYHQGDSGSLLPVDSIQEFNVEQDYKAEYGWKPGAAVNIGVKSGTNAIHGTAYAFGRTDALDASNYFTGRIPISLVQPGGSIGGHIIKNKLFYFGNFEVLNYSVGDASAPSIPSFDQTPDPTGDPGNKLTVLDACNAVTGNMANPGKVNPLSALIAGLPTSGGVITSCVPQAPSATHEEMFPFITTAPTGGNVLMYNPGLTTTNPYYNGVAKIDYDINDHHHLNGLFFDSSAHSTVQNNPSQLFSYWEGDQHTGAHDYALTEVWTPNSNWVNEIRGGYAYLNYISIPEDASVNAASPWGLSVNGVPTGYGIPTGVAPVAFITNSINGGSPQIKINGFSGYLGEGKTVGHRGPEGTVDVRDDVSYLHGQHAFKFGVEFMQQIQGDQQFNSGNGNINFSSLQNFLAGTVKNGTIAISNEDDRLRLNQFAGFIQDDWRVRRTVTLNLGLRYEFDAPPYEVRGNYIGNFYPNVNPATQYAIGQAGGPFPSLYNPDYKDFAPRFGVAWDVQGNGKTVVRAGASIVYSFDTLGSLIDLVPFGASVPSIGLNTSGTLVNIFTQDVPTLPGSAITPGWNTAGPVFPLQLPAINGVTYTGATCTYNGEAGVQSTAFVTQCPTNASTNPNFHTPRVAEWNLDIQHAITNNLTIEASYVGNHGWEASRLDINQAPIGWGWNGPTPALSGLGGLSVGNYCLGMGSFAATATCLNSPPKIASAIPSLNTFSTVLYNEESGSPYFSSFPYLSNIDETNNFDYSNYNALQVTVTERASHGLTFLAGYTFAHALDIASSDSATNDATDAYNPRLNYGNGNNDVRQRFTLSTTYAVPGIKFPAQMLQGWSASFIVGAFSGAPWSASDATDDFDGTNEINNSAGNNFQAWNFSGNPATFKTVTHNEIPCFGSMGGCQPFPGGTPPAVCQTAAVAPYAGNPQLQTLALAALQNTGCYVENGDVLTPPAYGTLGNAPKNIFRGPAYFNVDMSAAKLWKFKERYTATFRMDFFNLFNRADFTVPGATDPGAGGNFGCTCTTPDGAGSTNAVLGSGAAREVQLGLKLTF
jgi:carboxypeptidase family protein